MTDLHGLPLWLSMSCRVIVAFFIGDYWRFFKDCFQQKLILYNAPLFHNNLLQLSASCSVTNQAREKPWERGCSVTWSLNGSEAGVDLALIQTSLV